MVSCLHQCNAHIKRKLQVWRIQKFIPLVGAKTALTYAKLQTTPSPVSQYRAENGNLRKSGSTFHHLVPCLHQSNVYIKKKVPVWRVQKRVPLVGAKTALTCAGRQTTHSHVSQCRAKNGNLRKSVSTFHNGTVFAPKQCFYQNEVTGIESLKIYSSSRCENRTYLCGTANYPVSSKPV